MALDRQTVWGCGFEVWGQSRSWAPDSGRETLESRSCLTSPGPMDSLDHHTRSYGILGIKAGETGVGAGAGRFSVDSVCSGNPDSTAKVNCAFL